MQGQNYGNYQYKRGERDRFPGEKSRAESGTQKRRHATLLHKGEEFDVVIEEMGHSGDGIAKIEGYTVFVKNTEKGEKVKIKIKEARDRIAFAERLN